MSNRKQEILETSIELFNKKGCMNSSTRHIADELGISVGNLYYYYKNKEEIIIAIYDEFMALISTYLTTPKNNGDSPFDFYGFVCDQMELEKKYRFFRFEMNNIYFTYEKIKKVFEKGIVKKTDEFRKLYEHQIKHGYMIELDESEMKFICSNTWLIASQWELYWVIMKCENEKLRRYYGVLNLMYFIKPYLTKKGLEESSLLKSIEYLKEEIKNVM